MLQNAKLIGILVPIVFVIDMVWLGILMKDFYNQEIGELLRRQASGLAPRWGAAFVVYLLIPAGIVLFVNPALKDNDSLWQVFLWGALFGFVVYGVYDFTNLAVLEKWTLTIAMVDLMWGCVLNGVTATLARVISRTLNVG